MSTAAVQTIWCDLLIASLADAGVVTIVVSPGSRSTPLVAALAQESRLDVVTIIDERAAAFFALGVGRATGRPAALICTSGTAAAHYFPALIEASHAGVPLLAITADRPPELQSCGASQTIDQLDLYGDFVRGSFELGAPVGQPLALRAVRRTVIQAVSLARGPHPGPVHLEVPLRKPLEPAAPSTAGEHALVAAALALRGEARIAPPQLVADATSIRELAAAIAAEPDGVIIAGALPAGFTRDAVFALAARAGYPIIAEAGSQLRFGARPADVTMLDHADMIPLGLRPTPRIVVQLGAEPVAASWPRWLAALTSPPRPGGSSAGRETDPRSVTTTQRWVLAGATWSDSDSSARGVVLGDVAAALSATTSAIAGSRGVRTRAWLDTWRDVNARAEAACARAIEAAPQSEVALLRAVLAAVPAHATIQIGNSLPIRVVDHLPGGGAPHTVITQRGAAGIDGLIASAAGATRGGAPVLLVLGDVSFAHDLGGLLAARCASQPLAILVVDNRGGQIFSGLPVAGANLGAAFERHFVTAPEIDPAMVATALGARAATVGSPAAAATAVAAALATPGVTVIHAPVSVSGAHDVRRAAIELLQGETQ